MTQTIVTWLIIAAAFIFVARWAFRKITGKVPADCCSDEENISGRCSACSQATNCNITHDK